jgi:hypothetical protein
MPWRSRMAASCQARKRQCTRHLARQLPRGSPPMTRSLRRLRAAPVAGVDLVAAAAVARQHSKKRQALANETKRGVSRTRTHRRWRQRARGRRARRRRRLRNEKCIQPPAPSHARPRSCQHALAAVVAGSAAPDLAVAEAVAAANKKARRWHTAIVRRSERKAPNVLLKRISDRARTGGGLGGVGLGGGGGCHDSECSTRRQLRQLAAPSHARAA